MLVDYNAISQVYDDVRRADVDLINAFAQDVTLSASAHILDIGCGTGNYTDLVQRLTGATVYGVEPSAGMIARARRKNSALVLKQGDAAHLPFEAGLFQFVYMTVVIHHVPDIGAMFAEIRRVLRPDGRVCIVTQSHAQIAVRPIARFFPATVRVDQSRYPEGDPVELGDDFLALVQKKGYSMLHLISDDEYAAGLRDLETQLAHGPITLPSAGNTLVWLGLTSQV